MKYRKDLSFGVSIETYTSNKGYQDNQRVDLQDNFQEKDDSKDSGNTGEVPASTYNYDKGYSIESSLGKLSIGQEIFNQNDGTKNII